MCIRVCKRVKLCKRVCVVDYPIRHVRRLTEGWKRLYGAHGLYTLPGIGFASPSVGDMTCPREVPMGPLNELLASNHLQTLEFFLVSLRDVSDPSVDTQELLYNASVLAHYAQISTSCDDELGAPANLSSVFDRFVTGAALLRDSTIMETAGAQCLMLTGFFEDQMRGRHNIRWYADLGATFFRRAAAEDHSPRRAQLLDSIGRRFEFWRQSQARLSHELRDLRYVLNPQPEPPGQLH